MTFRMTRIDGPECRKCGCRDSRIVDVSEHCSRRTEHRICNHCEKHFHYTPTDDEPAADLREDENENDPAVRYQHTRCPVCSSTQTPIRSTQLPKRYHSCRKCGENFVSKE